jgi:hypothetical protein
MTAENYLDSLAPDPELVKDEAVVICQICSEAIAKVDLYRFHRPITTHMFRSIDEAHGVPVPFLPGIDFEFMYCPHCRKRFAVNDTQIRTSKGLFEVPEVSLIDNFNNSTNLELPTTNTTRGSAEVAHVAHAHKVAGSNPVPASNNRSHHKKGGHK